MCGSADRDVVEHHVGLSGEQVGDRRRAALVRDMQDVGAGEYWVNMAPDMWMLVPLPEDAMLSLPGLAFA